MRNPHLIHLSISIIAMAGVLSGCGGAVRMDSTTSPSGTGPVPTVAAVADQVNGVAPNRKQEVQFSESMDSNTINAQSFQVADSSGKMVQGTVSYDSNFNTASFLPNPALQANTSYTVTITTAVASAGGMHLAAPYTYTFNTRSTTDTSPISVNSVAPASGATCVSATTAIVISFDEVPDAGTLTAANLAVSGPGGAIPVTISTNVTTTQVVLTPTSPLPTGNITVRVQNIGDLADAMMTGPYTWSFSTACGGGGGANGNEYLYIYDQRVGVPPEFLAYAIDGTTGKLTPVSGMPFQVNLGASPMPCDSGCFLAPLADPLGRFLFYNFSWPVIHRGVGSMKVNPSTGGLDNVGTLIASDPIIDNISADPQGRFVYGTGSTSAHASGNNWIVSMVVGSNGQLSFAPNGPFVYPEGNGSGNIPAPAATDKFVFASDPLLYSEGVEQPSRMFTFELNQSTGEMAPVKNIPDGIHTAMQVITPSGKFLYSERHSLLNNGLEGPQELAGFQVNTDGSLTPIAQVPTPTPMQSPIITMSPNGKFLYVAGEISPPTLPGPATPSIRAYAIDQNTGSLSLTAEYTNLDNVSSRLWIDPATKFVYLSGGGPSNYTMNVFSVNPANGAITPLPGSQIVVPGPAESIAIVRPQ